MPPHSSVARSPAINQVRISSASGQTTSYSHTVIDPPHLPPHRSVISALPCLAAHLSIIPTPNIGVPPHRSVVRSPSINHVSISSASGQIPPYSHAVIDPPHTLVARSYFTITTDHSHLSLHISVMMPSYSHRHCPSSQVSHENPTMPLSSCQYHTPYSQHQCASFQLSSQVPRAHLMD